MKYITATEIAEKWNVSVRQVQRLLAAGRIAGAKKHGRIWLIPASTVKPEDFRKEKQLPEIEKEDILVENSKKIVVLPFVNGSFVPGEAKGWLDSFEDEDLKTIAKAEYYYFRGNAEQAAKLAEQYIESPDFALKLTALIVFIYANLPLGHIHKAKFGMARLKEMMEEIPKREATPQELAASVFLSTASRVLLHLPLEGIPPLLDYLRYLPAGLKIYACYVMAHQAYLEEDYSKALGIAQTALAMQEEICPIPTIYLQLIMAVSLMGMKRTEEAKEQFMSAWELAQKDDLIEPFGEHHGLLHGLIETCLKKQYEKDYERIIRITYNFSDGWRKVHNPIVKESVADNLTTTEFAIAMLANRRWTNREIAKYMNWSEHTVKRYMSDIYQKLGISSRRELHQFMLQ